MELKYSDNETHEECYRLILCAATAYLGPVARSKVMDLWHDFVEPLLGCPQHGKQEEEDEQEAKEEDGGTEQVTTISAPGKQLDPWILEGPSTSLLSSATFFRLLFQCGCLARAFRLARSQTLNPKEGLGFACMHACNRH